MLGRYSDSCADLDPPLGDSDSESGDDSCITGREQDAEDHHIGIAHSLYGHYVEPLLVFLLSVPEATQMSRYEYVNFVCVPAGD